MPRTILILNAGSSSIKFALSDVSNPAVPRRIARGGIEGIGIAPHLSACDADGKPVAEQRWKAGEVPDHEAVLHELLRWSEAHMEGELIAVGHRVVHGGSHFTAPVLVSEEVMEALEALTPLAPLHQPHNTSPIRAILAIRPELPQIACFDTAFHHTQAPLVTAFALPPAFAEEGVRRYGFHGLSYECIAGRLKAEVPDLAPGRVIVAHLGNGASLCAMQDCRSVETTMGFSTLDGLVMGTRCGAIDPGVLLYMMQKKGMTAKEIERLLYKESGMLGVSGLSSDMRDLLASDDPRAREAVALFAFRAAREMAALTGTLGGLDGIVFTAGIGEHSPEIRAAICDRLGWLGVALDAAANRQGAAVISTPESRVVVRVMETNEELMILRHSLTLLQGRGQFLRIPA